MKTTIPACMPAVVTAAADLTDEQRDLGRKLLPSVSLPFVERECPDALLLAKRYYRARDKAIHHAVGEYGRGGLVFDPKLWRAAIAAFDAMMSAIPDHLKPEDRR